ncbi:MAG: 16S rRNA (adenine(1518)-N(6)/adenine(1519)-N(6))-dimethyltransferase RsmA [Leptospirales bacterium]
MHRPFTSTPNGTSGHKFPQPRKSLGQNFLTDPETARKIAGLAAESSALPCTIIEIGPGRGILSGWLARMTDDLCLIERDPRLIGSLQRLFQDSPVVRILEADAMLYPFGKTESRYMIVSNLPYNISVPLYLRLLGSDNPPVFMVLMFQREVAKRLLARQEDPDYGHLSVVNFYLAEVRKRMDLPPGAFHPAPKVHSSVVTVRPDGSPPAPTVWAAIALSRNLFCYRRKSLSRAFRTAFPDQSLPPGMIFPDAGAGRLDRKVDGLTPQDFLRLSEDIQLHHPLFFDRMHQMGKEFLNP